MKFLPTIMAAVVLLATCWFVPSSDSDATTVDVTPVQVVPDDVPEKLYNAVIEYKTADWCPPCRAWKRSGARAAMEKQGWKFVATDEIPGGYPSFRVWVNGKSETFSGYSTRNGWYRTIKSIAKRLKR